MREKHASSAPKRWKTSLAALLSLTLGLSMVGISPAFAEPIIESPSVEQTAETQATEEVAVGQPESQEAEESAPTSEETNETSTPPTEESKTPVVKSKKPAETKAPAKSQSKTADPRAIEAGMSLEKTTDETIIKPGQTFVYKIKVGCSSNTTACEGATMTDMVPAPLVVNSVVVENATIGKDAVIGMTGEGKREVSVAFKRQHTNGAVGLVDGDNTFIAISVTLPADVPPEANGVKLINTASIEATNASKKEDSATVTQEVGITNAAALKKNWSVESVIEGSTEEILLTLSNIANKSNVGATSLTVTDPSDTDSKPFEKVSFSDFGKFTFPQGADQIQVIAFTADGETKGTAGATPVLPEGVDADKVTGFKFVFTNSAGGQEIVANGAAGSIELKTKLREGVVKGDKIDNKASNVAEVPDTEGTPATADDTFKVTERTYLVDATKKFDPNNVHVGKDSTVKLTATNRSNQNLTEISIQEPADKTAAFGNGVDFNAFAETAWPAGADTGFIMFGETPYELLKDEAGKVTFPADLPKNITAFSITFHGDFSPGTGIGVNFSVTGKTASATPYLNEITSTGKNGDIDATPGKANDKLTVIVPITEHVASKKFEPSVIEGVVGDKTVAKLAGKITDKTNVESNEIVLSDTFPADLRAVAKATYVTVDTRLNADKVVVRYKVGDVWTDTEIDVNTVGKAARVDLPDGVEAVEIRYSKSEGGITQNADVKASIGFEVTNPITAPENGIGQIKNILGINSGGDVEAVLTADKNIKLAATKSWVPNAVTITPESKNPISNIKLSAQNTSAFAVNSLTLSEPTGGTKPFDYVDVTDIHNVKLENAGDSLATLDLTFADKNTKTLSGDELKNIRALVTAAEFAQVVDIKFSLTANGDKLVPRDAKFSFDVSTKLRDVVRDTETTMTDALSALDPAWTIPNQVHAEVNRGEEKKEADPQAPLTVVAKESVELEPKLTKKFSPGGETTLFDPVTKQPRKMEVALGMTTGKDRPDRCL